MQYFGKQFLCGLQVRARFSFNAILSLSSVLFKDTSEILVSFGFDGQSGQNVGDVCRQPTTSDSFTGTTQRRQQHQITYGHTVCVLLEWL